MSPNNVTPIGQLTRLREGILDRFNLEELRLLVFDLGENYEDLRGETISAKIQALLEHLEKRRRVPDLLTTLKQQRPDEDWDSYLPAEPEAKPPYKGLQYFTEIDAHLFFGRDQLTALLVERLRKERFLVVVGASGSGKSSLVRAGLVPAIRRGEIESDGLSSKAWPIHIITPTDQPLKTLAVSLTRDIESLTAATTLAADLQNDSQNLDLFLMRQMAEQPDGRLLLVVDQFEELFTQCEDRKVRQQFVDNLVNAVQSGNEGRLKLVLTLRADFYAFAVQYESLRPLLKTGQEIVGEMSEAELRQAIQRPAEEAGWQFQAGLVATILRDVGQEPGALPLLSHALQETWRRREGREMTLAGYQAAGGVGGALAGEAQRLFDKLNDTQKTIARRAFMAMVQLGEGTRDTRRRVRVKDLVGLGEESEQVRIVLDIFSGRAARLITLSSDERGLQTAELSHEVLLDHWQTLKSWIDDSRDDLRLHRRLDEAAKNWEYQGRPNGSLWRPPDLEILQKFVEKTNYLLTPLQMDFYENSHHAEVERLDEKKRQDSLLRRLRQTADLATLGGLLLESAQTTKDAEVAALLVLEALDRESESLQAQLSLASVLEYYPPSSIKIQDIPRISTKPHGGMNVCDFTADGRFFAFADENRRLQVLDIEEGKIVHTSRDIAPITALAFDPRSSLLIIGCDDSKAHILSVGDWKSFKTLEHSEPIQDIAFIRHGREFAVAGYHSVIQTWQVGSWEKKVRIGDSVGDAMAIQFSPDGQWMATMSWHSQIEENVIRIRDLITGYPMANYLHGDPYSFALSRDGMYLAVNGSYPKRDGFKSFSVRLYELGLSPEDGKIELDFVRTFPVSVRYAAMAFDRMSRRIIIAANDEFRIFNTRDGREVGKITQKGVQKVAFVREGKALAAAGNGLLQIWDFGTGRELAQNLAMSNTPIVGHTYEDRIRIGLEGLRERIGRTLTPNERREYNLDDTNANPPR